MAGQETVSLTVGADGRPAIRVLEDVTEKAERLDGTNADVAVGADDQASGDLSRVEERAEAVDRLSPSVDVTADTAGAESKLAGLGDAIGEQVTGPLSGIAPILGGAGPAGVVGAAGLAAGALFGMASEAAATAVEVGHMADLLGGTPEDASRLRSAFETVGVEAADIQDVVLQTTGVLADQPGLAAQLGVTLGGSPLQNFQAVADAVFSIEDAEQRALLASQLFGEEGVRQVSKLTSQYGSLAEAVEAVPESMVTSAEDIENAREFSESMTELKSTVQGLVAELGSGLVPVLNTVLDVLEKLPEPEVNAREGLADLADEIPVVGGALADLSEKGLVDFITGSDDAAESSEDLADAQNTLAEKTAEVAEKTAENADAARDLLDAYDRLTASTDDVADATDTWLDTVGEVYTRTKEAREEATNGADAQRNVNKVLREARNDAVAVADATRERARAQADANGQTMSDARALDVWNTSMLTSASSIRGPLRTEILNHIAQVNQIPARKISEIEALIAQGKLAEANRLLADASKTRTTTITAQADDAQAESDLNHTARDRDVRFNAVVSEGDVRAVLSRAASNVTINQHFPAGTAPDAVAAANRRYADRNG